MLRMSELIIEWFFYITKKLLQFIIIIFLIYQYPQSFVDEDSSKITTKCVCKDGTESYMEI